jgi:hypothetical protein
MSTARRRRPWLITIPLVLFLLIAAAWSVAWLYLRAEADRRFTAWFEAESRAGRNHECPERSVAGYPFRIELRCTGPSFQIATPQGPARLRSGGLSLIAQVYQPRLVLIELASPFAVSQNGTDLATVGFSRARASIRVNDVTAERVSVVLDQPTLTLANASRPEARAQLVEFHARHDPTVSEPVRDFEINVLARGLATAALPPEQGANVEGAGVVRRWPFVQAPGPEGPIADWARGGGSFEMRDLRLTRGGGLMRLAGALGFSQTGRADGEFRANVAEPVALLGGVAIPGVGDATALLVPALTLVGRRSEFEGRRGTEVVVRLDNGALSIGAVQLGVFPPVF